MFFTIATLATLHTGWNLGLPLGACLSLWILLSGTGRLLDFIFESTLANRPSPPEETIYLYRTRVPHTRLTQAAAAAH